MIETLLGSKNRERVLIYLQAREKGYAREIAKFYDVDLTPIQKQLENLEAANVIYSEKVGRTLVFQFNPRFVFLKELQSLLKAVLNFYPEAEKAQLLKSRKRPRRTNKPL